MSPQRGYLASFDSYGDNLARAIEEHGYSAFTDPLVFAGLTVDGLRGFTDLGADALEGIRCTNLKGAEIFNSAARGFKKNLWLDEGCVNVKARKSSFTFSRESNVYVGHAGTPPVDCELFGNEIHSAGRGGGTHHGILAEDQHRTKIYDNLLGVEGGYDPSTTSNIRVSAGSGLQGWGNKHLSTAAAGIAENILSGNDVDGIDRWDVGEMVDAGFIATAYAGSTILPSYRRTDQDNVKRGRFRVARASLSGDVNPAGGTWTKGDVIGYLECDADGYEGVACTTSGTAGTLALVTGSITSGSTTLTVNDADDLRVGQYITIAGVTGTKKILEIVGVTVTIDSAASATVAAAAVAWSAPVFKQRAKILA